MREEVEAIVDRNCLIAGFGMVMSGEGSMPDPVQLIADWENGLGEPPQQIEDPEEYELQKALGLTK